MSIITNRLRDERVIANEIKLLRKKQYAYRSAWLNLDAKISLLIFKLNELSEKRLANSKRNKKKRGDGYAR